jgi:hypothetical protein
MGALDIAQIVEPQISPLRYAPVEVTSSILFEGQSGLCWQAAFVFKLNAA